MTGAAVFAATGLLVACLILGAVVAAVLKFGFQRGNHVWWLIPGVPVVVFAGVALYVFSQRDRQLHAGPHVQFLGSHSVTVSKKFGQAELDRAYEKLCSGPYVLELHQYTLDPLPRCELNLTIQAREDARRFVSISVWPHYEVRSPTYEALMFLFSKAVIESDPQPSDTLYSSPPPKLSERNASGKPR